MQVRQHNCCSLDPTKQQQSMPSNRTVHFCSGSVTESEISPPLARTSLHYKNGWPSGILIHQQNSHALHSEQCSGRYEENICENGQPKIR
jgi:hypothetical protein